MNIQGIKSLRNVKGIFSFFVLFLGIGFGAYFLNQQGGFELRKKAADTKGSQLVFTVPKQAEIGKPFTVELVLDTTGDPNYTISGVDAVVGWSIDGLVTIQGGPGVPPTSQKSLPNAQPIQLLSVVPGTIFDSYPNNGNNGKPPIGDPPLCGGIAGRICPNGFVCIYDYGSTRAPNPDAAGTCVPQFSIEGTQNNKLGQGSSSGAIVLTTTPAAEGSGQSQVTVCPPFPGCDAINNWRLGLMFPACWGDALTKCPAPTPKPRSDSNPLTISGVKNYAVDEKGYFKGFSGKGVFATFTFVASTPGTITLSLRYDSNTATNDTNINGFMANQPASLQKPSERLLVGPGNLTIAVIPTQTTLTPTPTPVLPTCVPEPPCAYEGILNNQGLRVYCDPHPLPAGQKYCPRPSATPTPTTSPTPPVPTRYPTCIPLPRCAYEGFPVCDIAPPPVGTTYCPRPSATPTPTTSTTPTPTPVPSARLTIYVESDGKGIHRQVRIYGQRDYVTLLNQVQGAQVYAAGFGDLTNTSPTPVPSSPQSQPIPIGRPAVSQPPEPVSPDGLTLLGGAVTDSTGNATVEIPSQYHNIPWRLFVQTPSHLIRQAQSVKLGETPGIPGSVVSNNVIVFKPNTVARAMFTSLIPGDLYIAEGKTRQDGVINNFDIAELFRAWGPSSTPIAADLNDDGVVNNRDFAIILANFGKEGDVTAFREAPVPLPATGSRPQP